MVGDKTSLQEAYAIRSNMFDCLFTFLLVTCEDKMLIFQDGSILIFTDIK